MQVKGNHTFKVTKQQLWNYLMDTEVLEKITPGVSKLEPIDDDSYKTISDIKIGPVKGSFKGKLKVVDKNEPNSFAIEMEQLSKMGNAHARIEMSLADAESNHSSLSFDGKAKLSGVIARTGQRVLSGVANAITKEVFTSLENHIEEEGGSEIQNAAPVEPSNEIPEKSSNAPTVSAKEEIKQAVNEEIVEQVEMATNTKIPKVESTSSEGFLQGIINFFKRLFN